MTFQVRQNLERLSSLLQRDGTARADAAANDDATSAPPQVTKAVSEQELGVNGEQGAVKRGKDEF